MPFLLGALPGVLALVKGLSLFVLTVIYLETLVSVRTPSRFTWTLDPKANYTALGRQPPFRSPEPVVVDHLNISHLHYLSRCSFSPDNMTESCVLAYFVTLDTHSRASQPVALASEPEPSEDSKLADAYLRYGSYKFDRPSWDVGLGSDVSDSDSTPVSEQEPLDGDLASNGLKTNEYTLQSSVSGVSVTFLSILTLLCRPFLSLLALICLRWILTKSLSSMIYAHMPMFAPETIQHGCALIYDCIANWNCTDLYSSPPLVVARTYGNDAISLVTGLSRIIARLISSPFRFSAKILPSTSMIIALLLFFGKLYILYAAVVAMFFTSLVVLRAVGPHVVRLVSGKYLDIADAHKSGSENVIMHAVPEWNETHMSDIEPASTVTSDSDATRVSDFDKSPSTLTGSEAWMAAREREHAVQAVNGQQSGGTKLCPDDTIPVPAFMDAVVEHATRIDLGPWMQSEDPQIFRAVGKAAARSSTRMNLAEPVTFASSDITEALSTTPKDNPTLPLADHTAPEKPKLTLITAFSDASSATPSVVSTSASDVANVQDSLDEMLNEVPDQISRTSLQDMKHLSLLPQGLKVTNRYAVLERLASDGSQSSGPSE